MAVRGAFPRDTAGAVRAGATDVPEVVTVDDRQSHAHDSTALPHSVGEQEPSIPDPARLGLVRSMSALDGRRRSSNAWRSDRVRDADRETLGAAQFQQSARVQ
jgi:hypothetical protein